MEEEMARGFRWRGAGFCCPLENQLAYREANRDSVTEVRFPLQNLRYLRLLEVPDGVTLDGQPIVVQSAYAEMEVYGRGFAPTATWESQIVDLGREVNFGRVVFEVSKWRKDGGASGRPRGRSGSRRGGDQDGSRRHSDGLLRL